MYRLKKELGYIILGLIFLLFLINTLAGMFYWYTSIWWFDMPMHFAGGVWLALAGFWILYLKRVTKEDRDTAYATPIKQLLLFVLVFGILWELFELTLYHFTGVNFGSRMDSLSDICFDLAGGALGILYIRSLLLSVKKDISPVY